MEVKELVYEQTPSTALYRYCKTRSAISDLIYISADIVSLIDRVALVAYFARDSSITRASSTSAKPSIIAEKNFFVSSFSLGNSKSTFEKT
jgi:hypothetical protein